MERKPLRQCFTSALLLSALALTIAVIGTSKPTREAAALTDTEDFLTLNPAYE